MPTKKFQSLPVLDATIKRAFHVDLTAWYQKNFRDLPWRRTKDPYAITVSEFMLQQTQVATVLPYYARWLEQFPDWSTLAKAETTSLLKAWEGLGYYRRARNLQKLAQEVTKFENKELPKEVIALLELPGIGPYTARAIASFAFGKSVGVLDGNVMRVLTRIFTITDDISLPQTQKKLWQLVEAITPLENTAIYNQAMMELGALICTPRNPQCLICPMQKVCRGKIAPEKFPVKTKEKIIQRAETIAIIRQKERWWCEQFSMQERLSEMWRFPQFDPVQMKQKEVWHQFSYSITKYRVALTAVTADWQKKAPPNGRWLSKEEMEALPFASAHRKLARLL